MARRTSFEIPRPYVLAHRGASGYAPENTFAAFDRAIEMGAPGAETDVRAPADGVLAPQPQPPARPGLVALPPIVFSSTRAESLSAIKAIAPEALLALNGPDFDDAALDAAAAAGFAQVCPHGINCTAQRVAA